MKRCWVLLWSTLAAAAAAAVACSGNWCATWSSKRLCDDFDNNAGVGQQGLPRQNTVGGAGGSFALNGDNAYSAPNAALGTSGAFDASGGAGVQLAGPLWQGAQSAQPTLTCALQLQAAQLSTASGDSAVVMALTIGDASGSTVVQLSLVADTQGVVSFQEIYPMPQSDPDSGCVDSGLISADTGGLDDGGSDGGEDSSVPSLPDAASGEAGSPTTATHGLSTSVGLGSWVPVQMQFTTGAGPSTAFVVSVDTQQVKGMLLQPFPSPMTATLAIGPTDLGAASSGWSFLYDNVICY